MTTLTNKLFSSRVQDKSIKLIESSEFQEIWKYTNDSLSKLIGNKTSNDLLIDCSNCNVKENICIKNCESTKRIIIILNAYNLLMNDDKLWRKVSLFEIMRFKDIYTLTQINDDFIHIKDHIDVNNKFKNEIKAEFNCTHFEKCHNAYNRRRYHYYSYPQCFNNEDIIFQEECDKIHSYLIHNDEYYEYCDRKKDEENKSGKGYIGHKLDEKWWNYTNNNDDDCIYNELVENMGIFRWQSAHGFNSKQYKGLMHLKPKYKNIKEEVLQNPYYRLSTDQWNQTLRKTTIFFKSFAKKRIKTFYDGKYIDNICQQIVKWKKGKDIDMEEIVKLKLYTDFDKLQYELKKCFRMETISDIFTLKNFNPNSMNIKKQNEYDSDSNLIFKLEERLQIFYWWRIGLITVLNKFGESLKSKTKLFHGVNGKMIINNNNTQNIGFYGPLSTSSSYHVARTFATSKGMVLQLSTKYPRLGLCRAFNASLISDYPEEKEWLIGFVYLKINKVLTRPLNKNWKGFHDIDNEENNNNKIPLSSKTRSIFFAIHLFRSQIFSMSIHSQYWLSAFLYLQCKFNEEHNIKKVSFVDTLQQIINNNNNNNNNIYNQYHKILNVLYNKFDNFRKYPNKNQMVKISEISDELKPYFIDHDGISFKKIIKIFENVKEIHFINNYLFDNIILNKLIQFLSVDKNQNHQLTKIKFLYYHYDDDKKRFFYPEQLNQSLLNRLKQKKWKIKHKNIGNIGYEIKIYFKK